MTDQELLERHKPLLKFDPQYDYRVLSASSALANPGNALLRGHGELVARSSESAPLRLDSLTGYETEAGDFLALAADYPGDAGRMEWDADHRGRIYGRVVRGGGRTWLQYWFWLYYNPKHLFGFGKHEGDWEMIQVGLGEDLQPEVASYAQHDSGEARPWKERAMDFAEDDPNRPIVYVAPFSHASYFKPGSQPYVLGLDDPRADGPPADLPLAELGDWASWPGKWGNPERSIAGRVGRGPSSPAHQGQKWGDPGAWHQRLRYRRFRVLLGRVVHRLGFLTYPHEPASVVARADGNRVTVEWELAPRRRGRHLYVTLHQGHLVIATRRVRAAGRTGETSLRVPDGRTPTSLTVSVYNRMRQRSVPKSTAVAAPEAARAPADADEVAAG
jgi:hypothetical protein